MIKLILQWLSDKISGWLLKKKVGACVHQFPEKEFLDFNEDPRCIHCGYWHSKIMKTAPVEFVPMWDDKRKTFLYTAKT